MNAGLRIEAADLNKLEVEAVPVAEAAPGRERSKEEEEEATDRASRLDQEILGGDLRRLRDLELGGGLDAGGRPERGN